MKKRNFFCNSVIALSAILGLTLSAQVKLVNGPIPLDGGYSEGVWKDVPEQTPFILLKRMGKTQPDAQTAFKVAADADNLYLNIRCSEKLMGKLKKTIKKELTSLPENVQKEASKVPTDLESVYPYPDDRFKGEV